MGTEIRDNAAAPVAASAFTSSATAFVMWLVERAFFHGEQMPPQVYGFLQIGVPAAFGFLGAEVVWWQRRRHAEPAEE